MTLHEGTNLTLILGVDVGTTYSGVSYAILDPRALKPGEEPEVYDVTCFPGQEHAAGEGKIPSILYYNADGSVHSIGAQAAAVDREAEEELSEDEDGEENSHPDGIRKRRLYFVQWFKLHLCPRDLGFEESAQKDIPVLELPPGKTVVDVYTDFLGYLLTHARDYITQSHIYPWDVLNKKIEIVVAHPNGWDIAEQYKLRRAVLDGALKAELGMDSNIQVHFITEGETGLHFCVRSGLSSQAIGPGRSVMIVDAGGGTVDLSSYSFLPTNPSSVREISPRTCIVQGSTRVTWRARAYLEARLKNSKYGNDRDRESMLDYFDKYTKLTFRDSQVDSRIKFGHSQCKDPSVGIKYGQLTVTGAEMVSLFQPSLDGIVDAIQTQKKTASQPISNVLLIGGFAANHWLYSSLQKRLQSLDMKIYKPGDHTNKAVAEGAVYSYLKPRFVFEHVAPLTYGTPCSTLYRETDPDHISRSSLKFRSISGVVRLPNAFDIILNKGTVTTGMQEISKEYSRVAFVSSSLATIQEPIICYRGNQPNPRWMDVEPDLYEELCKVHADTSRVSKTPMTGINGEYYRQEFSIVLQCGLTELKAELRWMENGKEQRQVDSAE